MSAFSSPVPSLYVHVPFCAAKCEYCAFFSELSSGEQMNRFVDALIREMELVAPSLKPRTIFFGGGTPSLLSTAQWRRVLEAMERLDLLGPTSGPSSATPPPSRRRRPSSFASTA